MYRLIALAPLVIATLITASIGTAATPTKDTFPSSFSFEDTSTCPGLTIVQSNEERDTILDLSPTSEHIQRHGVATLAANGKTLTSNFSATIFIDPSSSLVKVVGTVYNIQVPGAGTVLLDAGDLVLDVSTNPATVVHMGGPHQQLSGDVAALCSYLADS